MKKLEQQVRNGIFSFSENPDPYNILWKLLVESKVYEYNIGISLVWIPTRWERAVPAFSLTVLFLSRSSHFPGVYIFNFDHSPPSPPPYITFDIYFFQVQCVSKKSYSFSYSKHT